MTSSNHKKCDFHAFLRPLKSNKFLISQPVLIKFPPKYSVSLCVFSLNHLNAG